jgi:hypothetical protein
MAESMFGYGKSNLPQQFIQQHFSIRKIAYFTTKNDEVHVWLWEIK